MRSSVRPVDGGPSSGLRPGVKSGRAEGASHFDKFLDARARASTTRDAPGHPGVAPTWTSSAKSGVGTALTKESRVWFTLSHGILNEVYYPRIDQACTRDLGLVVTDGRSFFSEEKRHTRSECRQLVSGVPCFHIVNTCLQGRYRIDKVIFADPKRDVVLQSVTFCALEGSLADYRVYAVLAPHLGNHGCGNTATVGDYKGVPMLFAKREEVALALACSTPWGATSAGFVGESDGWTELRAQGALTRDFNRAQDGNVALVGEVELSACEGHFALALGFGRNTTEAGHHALASLERGVALARAEYEDGWREWHRALRRPAAGTPGEVAPVDLFRTSAAVLRAHESKSFPGALVASLSIPWGMAKGDDATGGYHLVWSRDLVEAAGGLLAAGAKDDAARVLEYLEVTQEQDGHWFQNTWLDGSPHAQAVQMDETALPILLVDLVRQSQALTHEQLQRYWPMVQRAASYLVRNGPVTGQERWEEVGGYSPFTLAAEIAALLVAAEFADFHGAPASGSYLRETADCWNQNIERWTYVTGTDLATRVGVDGYYVRIAPGAEADQELKSGLLATEVVSPGALALVRFGLRAADDPRILNTVRVIDAVLKVELPQGPAWHRYNGDAYGEHEDGSAFDGAGIGRAWPLFVGERAHYELAKGDVEEACRLLRTFEGCANEGGLLPEQSWDAPAIAERELFLGCPAGSAMPLVWAHAEYLKLRRSLEDQSVFDTPPQTVKRYLVDQTKSSLRIWRFNHKCRAIGAGSVLRIELLARARVHWGTDDGHRPSELATDDTGLGVHMATLPTADMPSGTKVSFTFYWEESARWEGRDFSVRIE